MVKELTNKEKTEAVNQFVEDTVPERRPGTFQPGQSGNPSGKTAEPEDLIEMLRYQLGKTGSRRLAKELIKLAQNESGQVPYHIQLNAIDSVYDRLVGKPRQVGLSSGDDEPLIVRILRGLTDDRTALAGRQLPPGTAQPISVDAAEVREVTSN